MAVNFTIREDDAGLWSVERDNCRLQHQLTLQQAVRESCELGRRHYTESGQATRVQIITADYTVTLAHYEPAVREPAQPSLG